jgi:hypothetical protein
MSSEEELPESLEASRLGVDGAAGALVSIVTLRALDSEDVLPAVSVAAAVTECVPLLSVLVVIE